MADPFNLRRIGILGGVAWPSTAEYYSAICRGVNAHFAALGHAAPLPAPPIHIESVNMAHTRQKRGQPGDDTSWADFDAHFRDALLRMQASGCEFAIIASTTPHMRLPQIRRGVRLPILSLLDCTAKAVPTPITGEVLILGTSVTMASPVFGNALGAFGIHTQPLLGADAVARMQSIIDTDFYSGSTTLARASLLEYCKTHAEPGQTIVLGCTELISAFPEHDGEVSFSAEGYHFVNPVAAHVAATVACALGGELPV